MHDTVLQLFICHIINTYAPVHILYGLTHICWKFEHIINLVNKTPPLRYHKYKQMTFCYELVTTFETTLVGKAGKITTCHHPLQVSNAGRCSYKHFKNVYVSDVMEVEKNPANISRILLGQFLSLLNLGLYRLSIDSQALITIHKCTDICIARKSMQASYV